MSLRTEPKTATFDSKWGTGWSILPVTGDTFTIEWKATIFKYSPGHCYIGEGFTLKRDLVTNAAPEFSGYGGLSVQYIDSLIIRDITVENFSMRNIDLQACHHPKVFRPVLNNANYAYNRVDGLGYGISINQCSTPKIISPSGYGNRRLIDFAGVQSVTTNAEVIDGDAFGGGLTSVGLPWWPEGETTQGGYGSHGGAHRTKYINCKSRDLFLPYNIRGLDELISDALHVGHCGDNLVYVQEGGSGVEVDGFKYMLRAFEYKESTPYHIMDVGVRIPNHFIGIEVETNRLRVGRPVRVTNVSAKPLARGFFNFTGTTESELPPISVGMIDVWAGSNSDSDVFGFFRNGTSHTIRELNILGGIRVHYGSPYPTNTIDLLSMGTFSRLSNYALRVSDNR